MTRCGESLTASPPCDQRGPSATGRGPATVGTAECLKIRRQDWSPGVRRQTCPLFPSSCPVHINFTRKMPSDSQNGALTGRLSLSVTKTARRSPAAISVATKGRRKRKRIRRPRRAPRRARGRGSGAARAARARDHVPPHRAFTTKRNSSRPMSPPGSPDSVVPPGRHRHPGRLRGRRCPGVSIEPVPGHAP